MSTVFALPREQKRNGVMLFTPNIAHAQMVLAALAVKRAALITHKTPRRERQKIVEDFRNKKLRYLVNVGTLTTGFDVPHVDLIAILRATESASLFQQIIGRGLRPSEDTEKRDCLILDYAENLARHCPDGDPFSPSIRAAAAMDKERMEQVDVTGPICSGIHQFRPAKHVTGTTMDANGYLRLEINNRLITNAAGDPIAGHLGRQCNHRHRDEDGKARRCQHTWACRECPRCGLLNTAYNRFCTQCTEPLTDGAKTIRYNALTSPTATYNPKKARVLKLEIQPTRTRRDDPALLVRTRIREFPYLIPDEEENGYKVHIPKPERIQFWLSPSWKNPLAQRRWKGFLEACMPGHRIASPDDLAPNDPRLRSPLHVTYRPQRPRPGDRRPHFFEVIEYHQAQVKAEGKATVE